VLRGRGRWLVDSNGSRGGPMNHQSSAGTDCPYSIQQSAAGSRSKTLLLVCFSSLTHSIGHAMHYKILKRDEEVRSGDRESVFNCSAIGATRQRRWQQRKTKSDENELSRLRDSRRPSFLTSIRSHPAATHFVYALGTTYAASMASYHHQPVGGMFGVFTDRKFHISNGSHNSINCTLSAVALTAHKGDS
jgi:hypothetical protein